MHDQYFALKDLRLANNDTSAALECDTGDNRLNWRSNTDQNRWQKDFTRHIANDTATRRRAATSRLLVRGCVHLDWLSRSKIRIRQKGKQKLPNLITRPQQIYRGGVCKWECIVAKN